MTFNSILLIAVLLMAGWAVQAHRRRRRFGPALLTALVSLAALVLAIRIAPDALCVINHRDTRLTRKPGPGLPFVAGKRERG